MLKVISSSMVFAFFVMNAVQERLCRSRQIDVRGRLPIASTPFAIGKLAMVIGWLAIPIQSHLLNLRSLGIGMHVEQFAVALEVLAIGVIALSYSCLGDQNQMGLAKTMRLSTRGIYRISRNPMYVGFHLLTFASVLYTANPFVLLLGTLSFIIHHRIVLAEEAHLERELSGAYQKYRGRVRRYL